MNQQCRRTLPPGPKSRAPGQLALSLLLNAPRFLALVARDFGPIASFRIGKQIVVLISQPEEIHHVLTNRDGVFRKAGGLRRIELTLGRGLLTSDGELHDAQRASILPLFRRHALPAYEAALTRHAREVSLAWRDGVRLSIDKQMRTITLRAIMEALFGPEWVADADQVAKAFSAIARPVPLGWLQALDILDRLPLMPSRLRVGLARLDSCISRLIQRATRDPSGRRLLELLRSSRVPDAKSHEQVRDEIVTLLLAGHETCASVLAWCWYLLDQEPRARNLFYSELDDVLKGEQPRFDHLSALRYTRAVLTEALRLYPPEWLMARRAVCETKIGTYDIPTGALVIMSPWLLHRSPTYFPSPGAFIPERWLHGGPQDGDPEHAFFHSESDSVAASAKHSRTPKLCWCWQASASDGT